MKLIMFGDSGVVALILVDDQTGNARCFHFTMPQVESAWSVCYNEHFLVCGSNSHRLTVWPIQKTDFSSSLAPAASTDESFTSMNVSYGHMTETNKLAFELPGHDHNVPCIDMHPTKNLVASVSIDGSVKIWRLSPDQSHCACLNQWRVPHPSDPSSSTYTRRTRNTGRNRATSYQDSPTRQETRQNAQLQQADEETANGQQDLDDDDDEDDNLDEREWAWSVRWYPNSLSNSKFIANDEQFKNHSLFVHRDSHERLKLMANMQLEEGSLMESTTTEERPTNLGDNNSNIDDEGPDSDDLLVIGTKHHVYLLNASTFELLSWFFFCPKRLSMYLPHSLLSSFSRLSLLEVIPEFSCILVASQTDKKILVVRVLRHMCPREQKMKYCMKPEAVLPNGESKTGGDSNYPIGSFSTQILPNRDGFLVRILFLDKSCRTVVVKSGFNNLMDPCFQVSEVMI